jgi:hypothetical protein
MSRKRGKSTFSLIPNDLGAFDVPMGRIIGTMVKRLSELLLISIKVQVNILYLYENNRLGCALGSY